MNDIAKDAASVKLTEAVKKSGLKKSEVSGLLGFKHANYANMIINQKHLARCATRTWDILQHWTNSGLSLRQYSEKFLKEGRNMEFLTDEEEEMINLGQELPPVVQKITESFQQLGAQAAETTDRMTILLQLLNEIKELGFDVDLYISWNNEI